MKSNTLVVLLAALIVGIPFAYLQNQDQPLLPSTQALLIQFLTYTTTATFYGLIVFGLGKLTRITETPPTQISSGFALKAGIGAYAVLLTNFV